MVLNCQADFQTVPLLNCWSIAGFPTVALKTVFIWNWSSDQCRCSSLRLSYEKSLTVRHGSTEKNNVQTLV